MAKNPKTGHPGRNNERDKRLHKTMVAAVELTDELHGVISEENFLKLRSAALGLMFAYAEVTDKPYPDTNTSFSYEDFVASRNNK